MNADQIEAFYWDADPEEAQRVLAPMAEAGDPIAQFYMGQLCEDESPRRVEEALDWYRRSSAGGYLEATHWVASFTYHGIATPVDVDGALLLLRKCAEAGLDVSQWKLGQHLASRVETRPEAEAWLRKAAQQGHAGANELLASLQESS